MEGHAGTQGESFEDDTRSVYLARDVSPRCRSAVVGEIRILRNGVVIDTEAGATSIMLDVDPAQLSDAGSYTCEVVFTDSTSISGGMGTLIVVGREEEITYNTPTEYSSREWAE